MRGVVRVESVTLCAEITPRYPMKSSTLFAHDGARHWPFCNVKSNRGQSGETKDVRSNHVNTRTQLYCKDCMEKGGRRQVNLHPECWN